MRIETLQNLLLKQYGLEGELQPLVGELDLNFKLSTSKGHHYIVKVAHLQTAVLENSFQESLLLHLAAKAKTLMVPKLVQNKKGNYSTLVGQSKAVVRVLTWLPGRVWAKVNPVLPALRFQLGQHIGEIANALKGFKHPYAQRDFHWDIAQGLWTTKYLNLFSKEKKALLTYFIDRFKAQKVSYDTLEKGVVHQDANDHNIIVTNTLINPNIVGLIDYGDACYTQRINDLAVSCAYGTMHTKDPLSAALSIVSGYHSSLSISPAALAHLYTAIGMRLVISLTKAALNKQKYPENKYLLISEAPAWELIKKWKQISPKLAYYCFRKACEYPAHPNTTAFYTWAKTQPNPLNTLFPTQNKSRITPLDLSVSSAWVGHKAAFNNLDAFEFKIKELQKKHPTKFIAGGYLEPRPLYTSKDYDTHSNHGPISRCIHLGIDFWLPSTTPVHAFITGKVVMALNRKGAKEYGGFIVLEHQTPHLVFYTLYGHLDPTSIIAHKVGDVIKKGQAIGALGTPLNNGNWAPHLHFQILLDVLNHKDNFPGVQTYQAQDTWADLCPDPNLLFKSKALAKPYRAPTNKSLLAFRKKHLGKSMSLQYQTPIQMVRGEGPYLIDQNGQKYLDTVNNVAHIGHEHPRVVTAGQQQMAVLNTNTRYLHPNINNAAKALLKTLPKTLSVVHFVNSGSEANELALRMAYTYTGGKEIIASEHGYHGNTNHTIGISSYKFNGKGGQGAPKHTHIIPLPNAFRGKHRGSNTGEKYAAEVNKIIQRLKNKSLTLAGFIIEPIISCGGQIPLPKKFLKKTYSLVRAAGGLCISDEVQTGIGRLGSHFWGFEMHGVVPDIITIGKPLGNGHPVAAVVCTVSVAKKFANGMEFFNTFGGNPVSCAIVQKTLQVVKEEKLQQQAAKVGSFLKKALKALSVKHPIIADVRGQGLFLGIELCTAQLAPLEEQATYVANRMKAFGILMSTDGPERNVLKIKPPMIFSLNHAKRLVQTLDLVLNEDKIKTLPL